MTLGTRVIIMSEKGLLLDTSLLVEFLRGNEKARLLLAQWGGEPGRLYCSSVTVA